MPVRPYIHFDGNARDAIAFYEYVFDTAVDAVTTFGEMPPNPDFAIPDDLKDRVWNSHMKIGGDVVQLSDIWPNPAFTVGNNVDIFYTTSSAEEIIRIYGRLMEGGSAQVELQEEDQGQTAYANVTDKFGVAWQLYTRETIS